MKPTERDSELPVADEAPGARPASPEAGGAAAAASDDAQRAVRRTTVIILSIILVLFVWYLVADRLTPYTASARFQAYVVKVTPDVSGYVVEIPVTKNQLVEAGDTLVRIADRKFQIDADAARATLEIAGQEVGAQTATVATATANLSVARTHLEEVHAQANRIFVLEEKNIVAKARGDEARAAVAETQAQVDAADAELERTKQQLGAAAGGDNPRIRRALAALQKAELNAARTILRAPSTGYVGALKIDEGAYAIAGQPLMTFMSANDVWVEAHMTENNLGRIDIGNKVELAFDAFPGQIFEGKVKSVAAGVSTGKKVDLGDLPTADKSRSWLRSPQRFPVVIQLTTYEIDIYNQRGLRVNSQADVIFYTGDHFFWNALGKLWIRIVSWFSYAY